MDTPTAMSSRRISFSECTSRSNATPITPPSRKKECYAETDAGILPSTPQQVTPRRPHRTLTASSIKKSSSQRKYGLPQSERSCSENTSLEKINEPKISKDHYSRAISKCLFPDENTSGRLLNFKQKPQRSQLDHHTVLNEIHHQQHNSGQKRDQSRIVNAVACRILDAPGIVDDFYLNLLDWSSQNVLAVALQSSIYLWNPSNSQITCMCEMEEDSVTSLQWSPCGNMLSVGTQRSKVQLWDVTKQACVRELPGHMCRVGSLAWNGKTLSSGGRDSLILHHDIDAPNSKVAKSMKHMREVCGLKWSQDGKQLASGANDNLCCIWDRRKLRVPKMRIEDHKAAVKALAWSPFQEGLLATGAGTADRHIRFYNCNTGVLQQSIDTKSQVCSLIWGQRDRELLSAHGFSQNQLSLWKYPSMSKVIDFTGHVSRVLHTTMSPDGTTVCSAAADETLRFWRVWQPPAPQPYEVPLLFSPGKRLSIR